MKIGMGSRGKTFALAVLVVVAICATTLSFVYGSTDIDTLKSRLKTDYLDSISTDDAASDLSSQNADGSWSNINYGDTSRTAWEPVEHLKRLKGMAVAYHTVGHTYYQSATMLASISDGIDYWYSRAPTSNNWWWNDIGKQLQLGPTGILMESDLTATQLSNVIGDLATDTGSWTGQNKVWFAQQIIWRGCLENSDSRVNTGVTKIEETIFLTTGDGVQYDYSFDQHGAIMYNAGYGFGFIRDGAYWAYMLRGTGFSMSSSKVDLLSNLLLEGDRWMVRRQMFDLSADGREISRKNQSSSGLVRPCEHLAEVDSAKAAAYNAFKAHLEGTGPAPITGNKHFWHNDFMTHIRSGYYVSVKMDSSRTKASETINEENLKGKWLSLGVTYIARRGDEYANIAPVWNWARLPGLTNPQNTGAASSGQSTTFVGGASDGTYGAAAMDFDFSSTQARKAWFFFDDEFVALGAGINSTSSNAVNTTLNQTFLTTTVTVDDAAQANGTHTLNNPGWVHHDGIGYVFPTNATVMLKNDSQSGNWYSINHQYETDTVTADVFTLWFDHGVQPSNASYQYIVVPDVTTGEAASYASSIPVRVIVNTTSQQAVRHDTLGVTGIVFYVAGSVQIHSGLTVQVDQPCIVLVDESGVDAQVTVSNPKNQSLTVNVTLDYTSQSDEVLVFTLPSGNYAGKSVTLIAGVEPTPTPTPLPGTRYPVADAYVNSGTKANNNYGTATGLVVKQGTGDYDRRAFLKFDISDISSVSSAKLRIYNNNLWAGATTITAYQVGDSWDENTLTYNTMPSLGSSIQSQLVDANGQYFEWDVTSYVQGKVGGSVVSFAMYTAESKGLTFSSREGTFAPELVIEEDIATPTPTPTPNPGTNLALNTLYATSGQQTGNEAPRAVDGDTGTRWSSEGFPQWIELDLGANMQIDKTELVAYQDRAYQFIVEAKPDGSTYTTVVDRSSNTTPGSVANPITDMFSPVTARYVKLTVTGASGYSGSWVSILELRVFGGSATPTTYAPTADAFVRSDSYANDNYGSSGVLTVKLGGTNYKRKSFFKFDLSSEGLSNVSDATLWMHCDELSQGSYTARVYQTSDSWSESTITWNSMPAQGSEIASTSISASGQWYSWDLTSYVNGQLSGDGVVSIVVYTTNSERYSHFQSREATANQPYLEITP